MQHLILSERLKTRLANILTIASAEQWHPQDTFAKICLLLECSHLEADAPQETKTQQIYFSATVPALPEIPKEVEHLVRKNPISQ